MKYEYINFVEIERKKKTLVWSCRVNRTSVELGVVKWYSRWRQYCYFPTVQAVYSGGCLSDIKRFIQQANVAHKNPAQLELTPSH